MEKNQFDDRQCFTHTLRKTFRNKTFCKLTVFLKLEHSQVKTARIFVSIPSIIFIRFAEDQEKLELVKDIDVYTEPTHYSDGVWDDISYNLGNALKNAKPKKMLGVLNI